MDNRMKYFEIVHRCGAIIHFCASCGGGLRKLSVFNVKELECILEDFYRITRIRITVFDERFQEIISFPDSRPEFCQIIPYTTKDGIYDDYSEDQKITWGTNGFWGGLMWLMYAETQVEISEIKAA